MPLAQLIKATFALVFFLACLWRVLMKPRYKEKTFKHKSDFEVWLKEKTKFVVEFSEASFGPTKWWIDEQGEVLHSNLQAAVWKGRMVKPSSIIPGKYLIFDNGDTLQALIIRVTVS